MDGNELYLVQSTMLKSLYKIGISKDPFTRYDQLNDVGQGLERSWDHTNKLGHTWNVSKIETALHRKYCCYRLPQSEWFKLPAKDVARLRQFLYEAEESDYTVADMVDFINNNNLKENV